MKRWAVVLVAVGLLMMGSAQLVAVEGVGAIFSLGSSGRALGMGRAFLALADDEGSVLHNPSGLGRYEGVGLTSLVARGFGGTVHGAIGLVVPYFGVSVLVLDSGPIPTEAGTLRYASQGVVGAIGLPMGPVSFGVRGRLLRVSSPVEGSGWSVDPAILVSTGSIRAAVMVEAAASSPMVYATGTSEAWEPSVRVGAGFSVSPSDDVVWNATFEAAGLFTSLPQATAGVEAWIGGLGARAGFDGRGATFGLSVAFDSLQFDWAYAMREDLGDSHRVSFTFRL